jgi:tetratricopeptide (TPR) repeat protein
VKQLAALTIIVSTFALLTSNPSPANPSQKNAESKPSKLPQYRTKSQAAPEKTPAQADPQAQKISRVPIDSRSAIRINYGYAAWNKSASKIDSASLLMREGSTGRIVQIHLVETEPDSSIFSGLYSIQWENLNRLQVEFYVPPQEMLETNDGIRKIGAMISAGDLKRRPFILRRPPSGTQSVEIFDNAEQATKAVAAYKAERQLLLPTKKVPTDQEVAVEKLAAAEEERLKIAQAQAERVRIEQLEANRIQALQAKAAAMQSAEKERRKNEAKKLAEEAMGLYREDRFTEAVKKFEAAVELDPENRSYFFQYGVARYKVDDYNRALIFLGLADGPDVNKKERDYYAALSHFRLKDYPNAEKAFDQIIATKDPELSPSSIFYKGVMRFEQEDWEQSRSMFQQVLDTSSDPRLDERAEAYIERILRIQQFAVERSRKWQISATLGQMADSNVLLSSDSALDQGVATDSLGLRSMLMGSFRYRPVYEETREFSIQTDLMTMFTLDKQAKVDETLRSTDPSVASVTMPWTYKGVLFGKGYKLDITPGYETIWMAIEGNQQKEIISSIILNMSNLFVLSNELFSNLNLEIRRDESKLTASTPDDDATAIKVRLVNSNMHFLTSDRTKVMTTEASATMNNALGKKAIYNRFDVGAGYMQPWIWDTIVNFKLGYYRLIYPQNPNDRTDSSVTLTAGGSKKLSDMWSAGLMSSYNINSSSVEANEYKKWSVMLTLSALHAF